jgi:hypothetical protein
VVGNAALCPAQADRSRASVVDDLGVRPPPALLALEQHLRRRMLAV